ncbi:MULTISPECIES: type I-E CRISPR-associated endoribonuclease Cas2e [Dehalococcoides]|uniref:type I-E CRISPR-associated endoribonuclease Cas2e n=1 Tax=Dehalococcoides TaxID=61434 RepID=UPI00099B952E|nr:type I-E CRISPR-associated endoribonuclease Cas2e [Dehalococcoides mccartyi]AQX73756.1 type I-E CRISPR-associated endoribonuclease Cas2 [Dehalococcoides mccartyi]
MILEKVPTSLRGALSRWLLEPKTGVFLGNPSARVRDELWERAINKTKESGAILQIWTDQNSQGFSSRQYGERERTFVDFEGLYLVKIDKNTSTIKTQNSDTTNP